MKIRTKLLLALSTLPIVLIVLIGAGLIQINHLNIASNVIEDNYDASILAGQIRADIKDERILLRNLVIFTDEVTIQEEIHQLRLINENIKKNISILESKISTKDQVEATERLIKINDDFNVYKERLLTFVSEDKKEEARALIKENSKHLDDQLTNVIADITDSFNDELGASLNTMKKDSQRDIIISSVLLALCIMLVLWILYKSIWTLSTRLNKMSSIMSNVANGNTDLNTKVEVLSNDEIDEVARSFNQMGDSLIEQMKKQQELTWTKTNIADITTSLSGVHDLETLGSTFLSKVVPTVEAAHAVLYVIDIDAKNEDIMYKLLSSYAFKERKHVTNTIQAGEGLIGQAILEKSPIILTDVPSDYVRVSSGLGEAAPLNLYVLPIIFEREVKAVLEIASFKPFNETQQNFLEELMHDAGTIIESVMSRIQLANLLEESQMLMEEIQAQSEELQSQQEELRAANEELEEQTSALRQSEEKLQIQQEELEQTNADLEEKAKSLEVQNKNFERVNREVEKARAELEAKAEQLALSSTYKSEFLANMSHELRTPLNSLLILSKLLADNPEQNLSPKQVEYSKTIYSSGQDLLLLINDILDLAKIESGKMSVNLSNVMYKDIVDFVEKNFRPVADKKGLSLKIQLKHDLPPFIYSDEARIQQVLKNLLSNAFKFTEQGEVKVDISKANHHDMIAFSVTDTGIGISKDKQDIIFEAFQQADGTTSRKYGGTGLGLSISRESAALLGGEIMVESTEGVGSTFTFYVGNYKNEINHNIKVGQDEAAVSIETSTLQLGTSEQHQSHSDRPKAENSHIKRLLIVDDDLRQRNSIMELISDMDFIMKSVSTGQEVIEQLKVNKFDCLILDLGLKDTSGFDLIERICEENHEIKVFVYTGRDLTLKEEMQLNKHAHTIIIKNEHSPQRLKAELQLYLSESSQSDEKDHLSNIEELSKNKELKGKKVLLVDDDVRNVFAISSILETSGMEVIFAENGLESLELLQDRTDIDIVLMDIMMPEMDGYEAIERIRKVPDNKTLPIIAVTAKAMKEDREKCLAVGASDYLVKPVDPDQLISLIKVWLYNGERDN
ncbi:response regulator [Lederbergia citri]|uniref:Circadian input-output histidine kinase CikA n=1 Tax=Lederbergia citri TaxID=2833580 RepID=A0A942TKQ8_9BACI|nr:response regulator [Lederbergia citri]MBS4197759.1 response regulator [Lederbergia citri]